MAAAILAYSSFGNISYPNARPQLIDLTSIITDAELRTLTRAGYIFHGWYTSEDYTTKVESGNTWSYYFGDSANPIVIYAKWELSKVIVDEPYLYDIADAIREKNSASDTYKPGEMGNAIRDLTSLSGIKGSTVKQYYSNYVYGFHNDEHMWGCISTTVEPNYFVQYLDDCFMENYNGAINLEVDEANGVISGIKTNRSFDLSRNFSMPKLRKVNDNKCILLYKEDRFYKVAILTYQNFKGTMGTSFFLLKDLTKNIGGYDIYIYDIEPILETEALIIFSGEGISSIYCFKLGINGDTITDEIEDDNHLVLDSIHIGEGSGQYGGGVKILPYKDNFLICCISNNDQQIICYEISKDMSLINTYSASYDRFTTESGGLLLDGLVASNGKVYLNVTYYYNNGWFKNIEELTLNSDSTLTIKNINQSSGDFKNGYLNDNIIEYNNCIFYKNYNCEIIEKESPDPNSNTIYYNQLDRNIIEAYDLLDETWFDVLGTKYIERYLYDSNTENDESVENLSLIQDSIFLIVDDRLFFLFEDSYLLNHIYEIGLNSSRVSFVIRDLGSQNAGWYSPITDLVVLDNMIVGLSEAYLYLDQEKSVLMDVILNSPTAITYATDKNKIIGITETTVTSTEKGNVRTI